MFEQCQAFTPLQIVDIPGTQPSQTAEVTLDLGRLHAFRLEISGHEICIPQHEVRQHALLPSQLLRVFEGAFQYEPGHGVDVHRRDFAAEPHCLQRDRPAPGKRVQHLRRTSAIGLADFFAEPVQIGIGFAAPMQNPASGLPRLDLFNATVGHLLFLQSLL